MSKLAKIYTRKQCFVIGRVFFDEGELMNEICRLYDNNKLDDGVIFASLTSLETHAALRLSPS